MRDSRSFRFPLREYVLAAVLALAFGACAVPTIADAHAPSGYAPSSMTWRYGPDGMRTIKHGHSVRLPRAATEIDVWLVRKGQAVYRYRQCYDRTTVGLRRSYFARTCDSRSVAVWNGDRRRVYSLARHARLRVYYWAS